VTPSEIAFLALGLLLGSAVGAAIAQSLAWRPGPRREVRVTITPNAIPSRRAYTLAVPNGFSLVSRVPGSPDERQLADHPDDLFASDGGSRGAAVATTLVAAARTAQTRTGVPSGPRGMAGSAVGVTVMTVPAGGPIHTDGDARVASPADPPGLQPPEATAAMPAVAAAVAVLDAPGNASSPVPEAEPAATVAPPAVVLAVPIATVTAAAPGDLPELRTLVRARRPVAAARPVLPVGAVGVRAVRPVAVEGGADPADGPGPAARNAPDAAEPCAPARRVVDERCALADVTREQARGAADALREAQRVYDVLRERVDRAQGTADPRRVAAAKEQLHAEFRVASDQADGPEETETAARAWLSHINQLNAAVREAQRILEAGNAELRAQIPVLDRLAAEADAARIAGENAEAGCVEAREELAACEEADVLARAAVPKTPEEPHPFDGVWPAE